MSNYLKALVFIALLVQYALGYYMGNKRGKNQPKEPTPIQLATFADTSKLFILSEDCANFVQGARDNEKEFQLQGDGGGTRIKFWSSHNIRIDSGIYQSPKKDSKK